MGLPSHNIHNPTVGSSSMSSNGINGYSPKDDVPITDLIKQKDELEAEMTALGSVLESHGVNMSTPLLTPDGFPRSDIDVAQIRTTRARAILLQNDHKALLARIEPKLHEYFAARRDDAAAESELVPTTAPSPSTSSASAAAQALPSSNLPTPSQSSHNTSAPQSEPPAAAAAAAFDGLLPFAIISTVAPDSPAAAAGLKPGDRIIKFGEADWSNHDKLALVARIVGASEGREVRVLLRRELPNIPGSELQTTLTLVPRSGWGGRGSLGCHLRPV